MHDSCQFYVREYDLRAGVVMDNTRQIGSYLTELQNIMQIYIDFWHVS